MEMKIDAVEQTAIQKKRKQVRKNQGQKSEVDDDTAKTESETLFKGIPF